MTPFQWIIVTGRRLSIRWLSFVCFMSSKRRMSPTPPWQHHFNLRAPPLDVSIPPSFSLSHHWSFDLIPFVDVFVFLLAACSSSSAVESTCPQSAHFNHFEVYSSGAFSAVTMLNKQIHSPLPRQTLLRQFGPVKGSPKSENKASPCLLTATEGLCYLKETSSTCPTFNSFSTPHIRNKSNVPFIGNIYNW